MFLVKVNNKHLWLHPRPQSTPLHFFYALSINLQLLERNYSRATSTVTSRATQDVINTSKLERRNLKLTNSHPNQHRKKNIALFSNISRPYPRSQRSMIKFVKWFDLQCNNCHRPVCACHGPGPGLAWPGMLFCYSNL